jgi:mycothiol system anti-sigma-R factor
MSCGDPHDKDCSEVLQRVFYFIDNELQDADQSEIQHHLDECGPCLQKYDLERTVKALVATKCSGEKAPEGLRQRLRLELSRTTIIRG